MNQKNRPHRAKMTAKAIACSALLAAISIVMARLMSFAPPPVTRWSLDKFPLFLAGMFFGPVVGGLTGFVADWLGSLMQYGFDPIYCIPPIIYGIAGGVFRVFLRKKFAAWKLAVFYAVPVVLASWLWQSFAIAWKNSEGDALFGTFISFLVSRGIQFAIIAPLEILILVLLFRNGVFTRMGLWPYKKNPTQKENLHTMTAKEAVEYIHSITWMGSKPGLERTFELLEKMGNPQHKLKFIHIAGTNGKGSTTAMTASILQQAGYRVGMFTSPCIYKFNERIQVNGENISDKDLAEITAFVKPLAAAMEDHPSEFELVSCIGFEYFLRQKCDIVVLEVGMGGALDSTNVIPVPEVAVLTNIGLDHTDFLGSTLEEIAETKAGIFKEGGDAVLYPAVPSVEATVERICKERNMRLHKADFSRLMSKSHSLEGQTFDYGNRKDLELPLLGDHQLHNAAVVLTIVDVLKGKGWNIKEKHIREGLRVVTWPGRFQIMRRDPLFIIDGGHNPQCIEALVKNVEDYLANRRIVVLSGVLADKDYGQMYVPVMPFVEEFVCITPPSPRKLEATELAKHLQANGAKATPCETIAEGVRLAVEKAGKDGVVLCFGSLYTIGDICAGLEAL